MLLSIGLVAALVFMHFLWYMAGWDAGHKAAKAEVKRSGRWL